MRRPRTPGDSKTRRTDWSRATERMPASFADQPRRDAPVEGRRDDGLDLVAVVTGAAALTAVAELATGDEPAREDAVALHEEDIVAAPEEGAAESEDEGPDEED